MLQGPEHINPKRPCPSGVNMDNPGTSQQQQQDSYNMRVNVGYFISSQEQKFNHFLQIENSHVCYF